MRNILSLLILLVTFTIVNAQTLDELKAKKANLEAQAAPVVAQADAIKAEIEAVNAKIATFPGWYKGAFGTLGANFAGRNNWYSAGDLSNSRATTIGGSFNAFLNNLQDKYFWRNSGALNLGWQKLAKGTESTTPKFEPVSDVLNITSLFGYKISSKLAASVLGEYRTSVIKNFNNPGYLDLGAGVTYTPMQNMIITKLPITQ